MTKTDDNQNNYAVSKLNSLKHGILSKHTVLPWEKVEDYDALLQSLIEEYGPKGATEEHLIEELAGVMWRKKRLRYAEQTSLQEELGKYINSREFDGSHIATKSILPKSSSAVKSFDLHKAVTASAEETAESIQNYKEYMEGCRKAYTILDTRNDYDKALEGLNKEEQDSWIEWIGEPVNEWSSRVNEETPESLQEWIEGTIKHYEKQLYELESRDKIKHQVYGQVFQPDQKYVERYSRYESHLDKKLERTLSTLFRLRELKP